MLKLKNIRRNEKIISADYDPEDSGCLGSVSIEGKSGKVTESKPSKMDEDGPLYLRHATSALREMKDLEDLPQEKLVMWC